MRIEWVFIYYIALTFIFFFIGLLLFSVLYIPVVHMYSVNNVISFASCLFAAQNRERKKILHAPTTHHSVLFLLIQSSKHVSQPCTARISCPNSLQSRAKFSYFWQVFFSSPSSLLLDKWFGLCSIVFGRIFFIDFYCHFFFEPFQPLFPLLDASKSIISDRSTDKGCSIYKFQYRSIILKEFVSFFLSVLLRYAKAMRCSKARTEKKCAQIFPKLCQYWHTNRRSEMERIERCACFANQNQPKTENEVEIHQNKFVNLLPPIYGPFKCKRFSIRFYTVLLNQHHQLQTFEAHTMPRLILNCKQRYDVVVVVCECRNLCSYLECIASNDASDFLWIFFSATENIYYGR